MGEAKRNEQIQAELQERVKAVGEAAQALGLMVVNPRHIFTDTITKMGPATADPIQVALLRKELTRQALREMADKLVDVFQDSLAVEPVTADNGQRGVMVTLHVHLPMRRTAPVPDAMLKNESVIHAPTIVQGPPPEPRRVKNGEVDGTTLKAGEQLIVTDVPVDIDDLDRRRRASVEPASVKGDAPPDVEAMEAAIEREPEDEADRWREAPEDARYADRDMP